MAKGGHDAPPTDAPQLPSNDESSQAASVKAPKTKPLPSKGPITVDRRKVSSELSKLPRLSLGISKDDEITSDLLAIFGENLKAARLKLGVSQSRAAELAGVTQQYLSTIECGQQNITLKTMAALAKVVDSDVSVLLSRPKELGS